MTQTASSEKRIPLRYVVVIALMAFALGAGAGIIGWILITGGSGEPSRDIQSVAPTLSLGGTDDATATPAGSGSHQTDMAVASAGLAPRRNVTRQHEQSPSATPAPEATPEMTPEPPPPEPIPFGRGLYRIDPAQSEVRFRLHEDLLGNPNEVVGITSEIAGDFIVDFGNPAASEVGGIAINARALATDNPFRNQALRGQILRSAEAAYEFILFTPTQLHGLPANPVTLTGGTFTFQVTGDLKIIEITQPVTFAVTVTIDSPNQISGSARATVRRSDFNLSIPDVPGVANVTEEVSLELDFVATLVESEGDAPTAASAMPFARGLYRIDAAQSEVRFRLMEDLRGQPNEVVGITREVAGDFIVDFGNPAASQVGVIAINARTLETDNPLRNRAIRGQILRSAEDAYEFITFTPTQISGLPADPVTAVGGSLTFQVTGDLKIIEITRSVTFAVTVTLDSPDRISGSARTTVNRSDFNLTIPNVPGVANVTEEVSLELDFVATLVESE